MSLGIGLQIAVLLKIGGTSTAPARRELVRHLVDKGLSERRSLAWIVVGGIQVAMDTGNAMSIVWQVLPYALLTFGEVLVSATGLEFAYSQAPAAMKGVIMSFWNLTTTIGNLWVLLANAAVRNDAVTGSIATTGLSTAAFQMFFFAAFALVAALAFGLYARRYREVDNYRAAEM